MFDGASGSVMMLVGSAVGFMLAAILLAVLGAMRERMFMLAPKLMALLKPYPGKKDAQQNHKMYNELVELRALAKSSRSYVLRFHNGNEFLPDNPQWKVTCTHETVGSGVSYGSLDFQNVLVSRVHNIVDPVITGASRYKGVKMVDCEKCSYKNECDRKSKHSVVVQVDEMEDSFSKFLLDSHGVKTMVASGMVNGQKVFGMVALDFCEGKLETEEEVMEAVSRTCRTAIRTQYYLQFKCPPGEVEQIST